MVENIRITPETSFTDHSGAAQWLIDKLSEVSKKDKKEDQPHQEQKTSIAPYGAVVQRLKKMKTRMERAGYSAAVPDKVVPLPKEKGQEKPISIPPILLIIVEPANQNAITSWTKVLEKHGCEFFPIHISITIDTELNCHCYQVKIGNKSINIPCISRHVLVDKHTSPATLRDRLRWQRNHIAFLSLVDFAFLMTTIPEINEFIKSSIETTEYKAFMQLIIGTQKAVSDNAFKTTKELQLSDSVTEEPSQLAYSPGSFEFYQVESY